MEKKLNNICEMITKTVVSADMNPEALFTELDSLKKDLITSFRQNPDSIFENNDVKIEQATVKLQNLKKVYIENKIKLRLLQESLFAIIPKVEKLV